MSLKPRMFDPVPDETSRVAKAAFPNGNVYMQMRDAFGALYADEAFAPLFSPRGQPGAAPACLALVTVMQFAEGLSDRQAANAVRGHIDWKYALGLELTDPGFDASVLSEFRSRLIAGQAEAQLFELMLTRFREAGLLKARGQQRTDSTHVLGAIHTLNRLECVGETLRRALNVLAVVAPDWLRAQVPPEWFDRYSRRFENYRLPPGKPERYALAETIGADGFQLLRWVYATTTPAWVRQIPAVEVLLNSPLIQDLIFKGEVHEIKGIMAKSRELGMQTFDQHLFDLYEQGLISYEDALRNADSVNELRLMIKLHGKEAKEKDLTTGIEHLNIV